MGDFNSSNEYLGSVIIGGHNFGNLSSDHQNQTYYNVFNGTVNITSDVSGGSVNYSFTPSNNVNSAAGYYSWNMEVTFEVLIDIPAGIDNIVNLPDKNELKDFTLEGETIQ